CSSYPPIHHTRSGARRIRPLTGQHCPYPPHPFSSALSEHTFSPLQNTPPTMLLPSTPDRVESPSRSPLSEPTLRPSCWHSLLSLERQSWECLPQRLELQRQPLRHQARAEACSPRQRYASFQDCHICPYRLEGSAIEIDETPVWHDIKQLQATCYDRCQG